MSQESLEGVKSHFQFGENWAEFSHKINHDCINEATESLIKLLDTDNLSNKTFLDIGCGSGLFSLAACLLNAEKVMSTDIDPKSITTTQHVLNTYAGNKIMLILENRETLLYEVTEVYPISNQLSIRIILASRTSNKRKNAI